MVDNWATIIENRYLRTVLQFMKLADYIKTQLPKWPNFITIILERCNIFGKYAYGRSYVAALKNITLTNPEERLLEVVNRAIEHVPYYKKRYGGKIILNISEFESIIMPITKKEVMDNWEEFIADDINWNRCITGTTGGTSGKPMQLVLPSNRYIHSLAFWHTELKSYGWDYDTRAVIRNHKLPKNKDYIVNPILKEFIFDGFRMNKDYAKKIHSILRRYNIRYIHAYPSAIYQFLKLCVSQNLDISFIKLCILSSEAVTPEQEYFIRDQLKLNICLSYGHSEKLVRATTIPDQEHLLIEENYGWFELLDNTNQVINEVGIKGEIVGTTFINKYFPLIRYKTGDMTEYTQLFPQRMVSSIEGHWNRSIIYKGDGTTTSTAALNLHGDVYKHIDGIQYIQNKKGYLQINIIKNSLFSDNDEIYLTEHFANAMGGKEYVEILYVDRLIVQDNGKFLPLISDINE